MASRGFSGRREGLKMFPHSREKSWKGGGLVEEKFYLRSRVRIRGSIHVNQGREGRGPEETTETFQSIN